MRGDPWQILLLSWSKALVLMQLTETCLQLGKQRQQPASTSCEAEGKVPSTRETRKRGRRRWWWWWWWWWWSSLQALGRSEERRGPRLQTPRSQAKRGKDVVMAFFLSAVVLGQSRPTNQHTTTPPEAMREKVGWGKPAVLLPPLSSSSSSSWWCARVKRRDQSRAAGGEGSEKNGEALSLGRRDGACTSIRRSVAWSSHSVSLFAVGNDMSSDLTNGNQISFVTG